MTFSNDFEQMLGDYNIQVSERTRRLIRRNNMKNKCKNKYCEPVNIAQDHLFVKIVKMVWNRIYFILSIIFKITLGIMVGLTWFCLFLANVLFDICCVIFAIRFVQMVIEKYEEYCRLGQLQRGDVDQIYQ